MEEKQIRKALGDDESLIINTLEAGFPQGKAHQIDNTDTQPILAAIE